MKKESIGKMCRWIQLPTLRYKLKSHIDDEEKVEEIMEWCELSSYDSKEVVDNVMEKISLVSYLDGIDCGMKMEEE